MKRYIAAVLIPCLLLQLFGCYSMREMSIDELKSYTGSDEIVIKTNEKEYFIYRKTSTNNSFDWKADDSLITIIKKEPLTLENYNKGYYTLSEQVIRIRNNEILCIETDEFNLLTTSILVLSIVGIFVLAALSGGRPGAVPGI